MHVQHVCYIHTHTHTICSFFPPLCSNFCQLGFYFSHVFLSSFFSFLGLPFCTFMAFLLWINRCANVNKPALNPVSSYNSNNNNNNAFDKREGCQQRVAAVARATSAFAFAFDFAFAFAFVVAVSDASLLSTMYDLSSACALLCTACSFTLHC